MKAGKTVKCRQHIPSCLFLVVLGLLLCLPRNILAQKNLRVIADSRTKATIDYVFIRSEDGKLKQLGTRGGEFILFTDTKVKAFTFYKMGYIQRTVKTTDLLAGDTIFLTARSFDLEEVVVKNSKIDTIVKDKRYYVDDYLALPNGNFILLTSKINVKGFEVCYYQRSKGITKTYRIKNETDSRIVTDCLKNVHVITDRFSRQVFFDSDSTFEFLPKYNRTTFDSALSDCMLKVDSQLIMRRILPMAKISVGEYDFQPNSPFLMYSRLGKGGQKPFYTISYNARMQEMIEHEISDWILMKGRITDREANNINLFYRKIAGPIYAPLFLKNDTVVVFNFQEEKIVFLNKSGRILKQAAMDHDQFATLHDFEIVYDPPVQKFYIKLKEFDKASLNRINIYNGTIEKKVKLEKIFARNIQILNDHIYYLVREKEWDDTQYLYLQN